MSATIRTRPGVVDRLRSRQSGLPSGLLGRIFGRAMVGTTADHNDQALDLLDLSQPRTVLDVGSAKGAPSRYLPVRDIMFSASTPHRRWSNKPRPATGRHAERDE